MTHVNVNGDVLPCCNGAGVVGNLRHQSFADIWNGETMHSIRQHITNGEIHPICACETCPYQHHNPGVSVPAEVIPFNPHCVEPKSNRDWAAFEKNAGTINVRHRPWEVIFAPTTICNLDCVMCPQGRGLVTNPESMELSTLAAISDILLSAEKIVTVGVGETLAARAFWRFLDRHPKLPQQYIRTNSNGTLINAVSARRIVHSALSEISISIDAATRETYQKIRGGDFTTTLTGIRHLVEAKRDHLRSDLLIYANMTLMLENVVELEDFVILYHEIGVDAVVCSQLFSFGDTPSWVVRRGDWEFVYSQQMLGNHLHHARKHITAAYRTADRIGMGLYLECNTEQYIDATAVAESISI